MNTTLHQFLEAFENKYLDRGDERLGQTKHRNTILQQQIDDIRAWAFPREIEAQELADENEVLRRKVEHGA